MGRTLAEVVQLLTQLLTMLLVIYSLASWVLPDPFHPARQFLEKIAEPIVRPFRNIIPPVGMFDLSIMVAIISIQLAGQFLVLALVSSFR